MASDGFPPAFDLAAVKRAICDLPRQDRARLQSWILARFDVRGYPEPGGGQAAVPLGGEEERGYGGDGSRSSNAGK
ncbi:MAG: hypothetical protein JWP44_4852 [Mucilaginibacter sp.]|nr:hypothetical protein [Mucilaginibacter sp.]